MPGIRTEKEKRMAAKGARFAMLLAALGAGVWSLRPSNLAAQTAIAATPSITAIVKGPNQINLVWPPVQGSHYGYLVEIKSSIDNRYTDWTELQPIPKVGGYTCDSSIEYRGGTCKISDPVGSHVYNSSINGVPYWVTDRNYADPQDGSPAQFIVWSLKPNVPYTFRVRAYSGTGTPRYRSYSNVATATTARYTLRYVSPNGNDSNDGTAADSAHAWRTLTHGGSTIRCGQALIVMGGEYAHDSLAMQQTCPAEQKAVVMVNPGDTATIASLPERGAWHTIFLAGSHTVVDGLRSVSPSPADDYDIQITGSYNALLNIDVRPPVVPSFKGGVLIEGHDNLVYRSALQNYGSPDAVQNVNGNSGFVLAVIGKNATDNVIWSNHLTRGGHDVSLCKSGCSYNRWLNNIMDGGWGMGFENISGDGLGAEHNLVEGNVIKDVGRLVSFYKPSIEVSGNATTVRRNVILNSASWAVEESALSGNAAHNAIYNNVFYGPAGCLFQSSSSGPSAYDSNVFANNICYKLTSLAMQIYTGNKTSAIARNAIVAADKSGKLLHDQPIIIWNQNGGSDYEYAKPLSYADKTYSPPFTRNKELDVDPRFVNEPGFDFHLSEKSSLVGAGMSLPDSEWGTAEGPVDLGAFGVRLRQDSRPWRVPDRPKP
jgi:hypothetical protein